MCRGSVKAGNGEQSQTQLGLKDRVSSGMKNFDLESYCLELYGGPSLRQSGIMYMTSKRKTGLAHTDSHYSHGAEPRETARSTRT